MKKIINKKNKGFTLVELLGVIIILAFLAFLVSEVIINNINDTNNKMENLAIDTIISSAREYVSKNPNEFPKVIGDIYYLTYEKLMTEKLINDDMLPKLDSVEHLKSKLIQIEYNGNNYTYTLVEEKSS